MILISTSELNDKLLNSAKIVDASWHFLSNRNGLEEYKKEHIENAIFFDLEKNSNQQKNLPHNHFLPEKKNWEKALSNMGISNNDKIIIYDNSDLITSCRCWFQFLYFGHKPDLLFILNGGMKKWKLENRKISDKETKIKKSKYFAKENKDMIKIKSQIDENIKKNKFKLIDSRSKARFDGQVQEPRPNVKSGSIKGSVCLPYSECIDSNNNTFLNKEILKEKFESAGIVNNNVVFTCGSSVTASVLGVAYSLINNNYMPTIYIGSWSEYGKIK
jgi:thiosulfate/3-mercaptopyruvate sulfurtransferase